MNPPRAKVLGVGISAIDIGDALQMIEWWIESRDQHYVCVCTVNTVMECQKDPQLRKIVNSAGLATPDGVPLVWLTKLSGFRNVDRVYGPDLLLAFCALAENKGYSNFFYGGADGVPEELAKNLQQRFPKLKIVGTFSPPFRPLTPEEDRSLREMIDTASPDVLWVGLSTPKQERWMADHLGYIRVPVMIGVGAAFDFLSGRVKQAPRWMQRSGLEWLFRLSQEPRRLWRRYLIYNPLFIYNLFLQWTGLRDFE